MKKKIIPIAILFISSISYSQINIDDAPEKKISVIPYDGSFPKLDYTVKDGVAKGLIGEKVTLLDVTYYDVELENGDRAPYEDAENFINKTYEITAYEKDLYPKFTIKSDLGTYKWKVTSSSKYVFNKFLDAIKSFGAHTAFLSASSLRLFSSSFSLRKRSSSSLRFCSSLMKTKYSSLKL